MKPVIAVTNRSLLITQVTKRVIVLVQQFGLFGDKVLPFLVLEGVALPQTDLVCSVGVLLDLLKEQVAAMARRTFAYFLVMRQLPLHLAQDDPFTVTHALVTSHLDKHTLHGAVLKIIWEI